MRRFVSSLVAAELLSACGGGGVGNAPAVVAVYVLLGSMQCSGGGTTADALQKELIAHSIDVIATRCGLDGLPRPQVCGESDGHIAVFDVVETQAALALAIGFSLLSTLSNPTVGDCQ